MKALTNILTHMLLMLLLLMLATCTEEAAQVDDLSRGEQYVTVRMNIPGMTAAATRAGDGVIETIHALAFDSSKKLLGVRTATNINNANENDGFNGTFNITVPNGTETIHFLANVGDYDFSSVNQESDLSNLSIGDWNMLRYWGKATYDGNNSTISTTLYRNLAKISIMPSKTDPEFNQFTQDELKMTGFYNANERGALVPCKDGQFNFDNNSNYCTMPHDLTSANYELYHFETMTAFEHENTESNPTYIICKIGNYHYKVALVDDNGNRYPIIRNHHYIIYVSDVDDYAHDDNYRADIYEKAFDKLPINLEVEVIELQNINLSVNPTSTSLYYDSNNTQEITVTIPGGKTLSQLTIQPSVDCVDIAQSGNQLSGNNGVYTYAPEGGVTGNVTFTIAPSANYNFTSDLTSNIVFGGTGENMSVTTAQTTVKLSAMPKVAFYYDKNQSLQVGGNPFTVTMQVPYGGTLNTLNIKADGFEIKQNNNTIGTNYYSGSNLNYSNTQIIYTFVPTSAGDKTITFSGSGTNLKLDEPPIDVTVGAGVELSVTPTATINMDNGGTSAMLTLTKPTSLGYVQVNITDANGAKANSYFTIKVNNNDLDYYSFNDVFNGINDNNGSVSLTLAVKNNNVLAGDYTATFTGDYSGQRLTATAKITIINTSTEEPEDATMSVTPTNATINLDSNGEKSVILTLSKPADVKAIQINHAGKFNVEVLDLTGYGYSDNEQIYYLNGTALETGAIDIQLKLIPKDGVVAGSYLITIAEQNNKTNSVSATIKLANLGTGTEIWNEGKTLNGTTAESGVVLSYDLISQYIGWTMTIVLTTEGSNWKQIVVERLSERGKHVLESSGDTLESSYSLTIPSDAELNNNGLLIYGHGGVTVTNILVEPPAS